MYIQCSKWNRVVFLLLSYPLTNLVTSCLVRTIIIAIVIVVCCLSFDSTLAISMQKSAEQPEETDRAGFLCCYCCSCHVSTMGQVCSRKSGVLLAIDSLCGQLRRARAVHCPARHCTAICRVVELLACTSRHNHHHQPLSSLGSAPPPLPPPPDRLPGRQCHSHRVSTTCAAYMISSLITGLDLPSILRLFVCTLCGVMAMRPPTAAAEEAVEY